MTILQIVLWCLWNTKFFRFQRIQVVIECIKLNVINTLNKCKLLSPVREVSKNTCIRRSQNTSFLIVWMCYSSKWEVAFWKHHETLSGSTSRDLAAVPQNLHFCEQMTEMPTCGKSYESYITVQKEEYKASMPFIEVSQGYWNLTYTISLLDIKSQKPNK